MVGSVLKKHRFRLPGWGALFLGIGALFAGGARAGNPEALGNLPDPPNAQGGATDDVAIRLEGGTLYVTRAGGTSERLALGDTPEAAHFRKLLDEAGVTGPISIPIGATIVASGGGTISGRRPKTPETTTPPTPQPGTSGSEPTK